MKGNYILVLMMVFLEFSLPASEAYIIGLQTIQESLNLAPIVLKGEVLKIEDFEQGIEIFSQEDVLDQAGGKKKRAQMRIQAVIKGTCENHMITVIFYDPFMHLEKGQTYILFLSESQHGLRIFDPFNGGIRVEPGGDTNKETIPIKKMISELNHSLKSKDEIVLCTAILGLAEIGSPDMRPRIRQFLEHESGKVQIAAISACLRLGDWYLITNAVDICISPSQDSPREMGGLGLQSLSAFRSLMEGLGSVTNREAIPLLLKTVNRTNDKLVRRKLVESLTSIQDERNVPLLLKLLHDADSDISFRAYRALANMAGISYLGAHIFEGDKKRDEIEKLEQWSKERSYRKSE